MWSTGDQSPSGYRCPDGPSGDRNFTALPPDVNGEGFESRVRPIRQALDRDPKAERCSRNELLALDISSR